MIFQVRPGPIYRSTKPVRDPNYTRYVKQFPCVGCRRTWGIDPCHCGPHGLSQKASDLTVIPLCRACHRLFDADPKTFTESRRLDVPALQRMFQRFYCLKHGTQDWWPNQPNLTLQACPKCEYEGFQEEMEIVGCEKCGWKPGTGACRVSIQRNTDDRADAYAAAYAAAAADAAADAAAAAYAAAYAADAADAAADAAYAAAYARHSEHVALCAIVRSLITFEDLRLASTVNSPSPDSPKEEKAGKIRSMKKKIHSVEMIGWSLMEVQGALTEVFGAARRIADDHGAVDPSVIDIENQDGEELASVDLIEETLTDGSKVYNIELRFSNVE